MQEDLIGGRSLHSRETTLGREQPQEMEKRCGDYELSSTTAAPYSSSPEIRELDSQEDQSTLDDHLYSKLPFLSGSK